MTYATVEDLLAAARRRLQRLTPRQAAAAVDDGALIVDIRPGWQRRIDGEVPGSLIIERNHLEWRLHPDSAARVRQADSRRRWIVLCQEGYASSLAAASLQAIGLDASDVDGGIRAWRSAGLPVSATVTPVEQLVPAAG